MNRWLIVVSIIALIGCNSIKTVSPTPQELNIPENFNNYFFTDLDQSPTYTIRISIHVIQDSMGKGNFTLTDSLGNHAPEWYWLRGLVDDASKRMGDLQAMHLPTTSNHIKDSRIRYEVVDIYDWQDQGLFNLSKIYPSTGNRMYKYIMEQDEVTYKENSLHLFIAGSTNNNNNRITSRGIASGAPDKRWTVLFNYYHQYNQKKQYWPASLISHEIGHNLGLSHTWNRADGCDDTPRKDPQCWALNEPKSKACDELTECSNNLMDYNAWQNALTECQLAKIHYNIEMNKGNLGDIIQTSKITSNVITGNIEGPKSMTDTETYLFKTNMSTAIGWYVSPREAVIKAVGKGNKAILKRNPNFNGKAILSFTIKTQHTESHTYDKVIRIK